MVHENLHLSSVRIIIFIVCVNQTAWRCYLRHFLHYLFIHTNLSRCGLFAVKLCNFDSLNSYSSSVEGNIKESMVIRGNFPKKYAEKIEDATAYKNILFIRGLY